MKAGSDGKKSEFKKQNGAGVLYKPEDKKVRTDADVRLMTKDSVYTLGLSNVGNGSNLDVTYGKQVLDKVQLRVGLFDGKLGVGADIDFGTPFSLSAALFDLRHSSYRIRSDIQLWKDTYAVGQWTWYGHDHNRVNYFGLRKTF